MTWTTSSYATSWPLFIVLWILSYYIFIVVLVKGLKSRSLSGCDNIFGGWLGRSFYYNASLKAFTTQNSLMILLRIYTVHSLVLVIDSFTTGPSGLNQLLLSISIMHKMLSQHSVAGSILLGQGRADFVPNRVPCLTSWDLIIIIIIIDTIC
jgi:hypothetical protein